MVSKNNHEQKFEAVADRKPHFAIRKLTIGAASVLLGTSLWMSTSASTVHADKADSNGDGGQPDTDYSSSTSASTGTVDKVVVEQQGQSATENTNNSTDNSAATSEQTQNQNTQASTNEASQASSENAQQNNAITSEEKNSDATANSDNTQSANTEEKASTQKDETTQNNQKTTEQKADSDKSSQNNSAATKQAENSSEQSTIRSNNNNTENKANSVANNANVDNSNITNAQTDLTQSANVQLNNLPSSSAEQIGQADKTTVKSDKNDTNELKIGDITTGLPDDALKDNLTKGTQALVKQAVTNGEIVAGKNADPTKQLDALRASLVEENGNEAKNTAVNEQVVVRNWSEFQDAINNDSISQIRVQGNIVANNDVTTNRSNAVTIEGTNLDNQNNKGETEPIANIDFGNHTIKYNSSADLMFSNINIKSGSELGPVDVGTNATKVTFRNVKSTGGPLFNGGTNATVIIKGDVSSDVDNSTEGGWTSVEGKGSRSDGQLAGDAVDWRNRRVSNIVAGNLNVDDSASLTLTRSANGNGVELAANGTVKIGNNGKLNITLSNAAAADSAVLIQTNGHFITSENASVDLSVGNGRGLVLGQAHRSNALAGATSGNAQYPEWGSYQGTDNVLTLGANTTFNFSGRDGVLMGNHATFTSGENSRITFNNVGQGVAFDMGDDANFIVSPRSIVRLNSDGKNGTGDWAHSNYIGMNERANLTVQHDGQLFVNMINRGGHFYNDTINLDTRNPNDEANVYVGNNAVLSVSADGTDYYPELISTPLGTPKSNFIFDNVRYVNLQRNSVIIGHNNNPNLIFMSGSKGDFKGQGLYKIYQWNKKNFNGVDVNYDSAKDGEVSNYQALQKQLEGLADNTWTGVTSFDLPWSAFNPKNIQGDGLNNLMSNHGVAFKDSNHGFNPQTSQRLVITSMKIPSEETTTKREPIPHDTINRYNPDLNVGQSVNIQKGVDGYKETTTTTYYITTTDDNGNVVKVVDPDKPATTSTKTIPPIDEINEFGPQEAKVVFIDQDNGNKEISSNVLGKDLTTYIGGENGTEIGQSTYTVSTNGQLIDNKQVYSPDEIIKQLQDKNYELVSNGYSDAVSKGTKFDDVVDSDLKNPSQVFQIVFKHKIAPVGPNNPDDQFKSDYTKDVKETVHYVGAGDKTPKDNIQNATWTRTLTVDKVTGQLVPKGQYDTDWTPSKQNYNSVKTPDIAGYTADIPEVEQTPVTQQDIEVTVTYKPNPVENNQVAQLIIYDDTNKSTLDTISAQGKGGSSITFQGDRDAVDSYLNNGYVFEKALTGNVDPNGTSIGTISSDTYNISYGTYDKDDNTNQSFTIYLKHAVQPVTPKTPSTDVPKNTPKEAQPDQLTKQVNLNVKYVNSDGTTFTGTVPATAHQTATFTGTAYIDKVNGNLVNAKQENGKWVVDDSNTSTPQITWTADKTSFDKVVSPVEQKYHLVSVSSHQDGNDVGTITGLTKDSSDITVTVTYEPNGHIIPHYPDPSDPTKPGEVIPNVDHPQYPTDPTDPSKVTPKEPVPNIPGYKPNTPTVTPTNPGTDTPVIYTPDVGKQNAVVNYVDGDENNRQLATSGTLTGDAGASINYSTAQTIGNLENQGYVLVNDGFPAGATYDSDDNTTQTYTVVFKHGVAPVDPKNPGKPGEPINPNDPNGPTWPADSDKLSATVTRTINYVDEDGKPVNGAPTEEPSSTYQQSVTFTREGYVDKVTGKWVTVKTDSDGSLRVDKETDAPTWSENDSHTFDAVTAKDAKSLGYDAVNPDPVSALTVNHNSKDSIVTVVYKKNAPTADVTDVVTYYDDTTHTQLRTDTAANDPTLKGQPNTTVTYTTADKIKSFTDSGYKLVSNDFKDGQEKFGTTGKSYQVHLVHEVQPITPNTPIPDVPKNTPNEAQPDHLKITATRNIEYKLDNGSGDPASMQDMTGIPTDAIRKQTVEFDGTVYVDKTNGKIVNAVQDKDGNWIVDNNNQATPSIKWTATNDGKFAGFNAPVVDNYTNNPVNVPEENVQRSSKDTTETVYVVYTPKKSNPEAKDQLANVIFRDVSENYRTITDSTTLNGSQLTGKAGDVINFDAQTEINNLKNSGYVLVHDGFTTTNGQHYDNDDSTTQTFYIDLKHGIQPVNPTNPGKPGEPINPNDPDGPKYPAGTDVVSKDVTENITYEGLPSNPDKVTRTLHFTGSGYLDKVTGKWTDAQGNELSDQNIDSALTWTSNDGTTFTKVNSPYNKEYHITEVSSDDQKNHDDGVGNVAEITGVDHTYSQNQHAVINIVVKYAKNGHVIPVDPNNNPLKDIPDNATPVFPTDPTNPKKTTTVPTPDIPGYTPVNGKPGDPVNPGNNPSDNVNVPYKKTPETPAATTGSITYIDQTNNDAVLENREFSGNVGDRINYTTQDRINYYESIGYDLVSNNFTDGTQTFAQNANDNIFRVVLKHATTPVTPDNPGKPGDPVPKDPNNPKEPDHKYPDNYVPQNLNKTVTRDVTYIYADGSQALAPVHQQVEFKGNGVLDLVTGNLVNLNSDGTIKDQNGKITWTPETGNYDATAKIDQDQYQIIRVRENNTSANVDETTGVVAGETVNPNSQNSTVVITLAKKTPETPAKDQIAQIIYRDVNDSNNPVQIGTSGNISGKSGSEINYDPSTEIQDFENKGYELKNNGFPQGAVFDNDDSKTQTFYIDFVHKTTTITPDNPGNPGEPINPNDPNGPKWPTGTDAKTLRVDGKQTIHYQYSDHTQAAPDNVQNTTFDHTLVFDNVTGQQVEDRGWTPESHKFNDVTSPAINGYHTTQTTVTGATVTPDNPTSEVTVIYTKNGTHLVNQQEVTASQVVKYVDDQGNELRSSKNQNFTFVYSGDTIDDQTNQVVSRGSWTEATHDFTAENVPVIDGYVAVSGYTNNNGTYNAGGFTTSHDASDAQRNRTFTVVYKKVGKIIPVDPNHNPIPNVPTPQYPNDPVDPTKVTPNEPVPNVPNMTPETPNVTPTDPTTDTPVIYNPDKPVTPAKDQVAQVIYRDVNDPNNITQIGTSGDLTGASGSEINYNPSTEIQNFENKGYELKNNGFPAGAVFDNDDSKTQTFYIDFVHKTTTVTPDNPGKPGEPVDPNNPDGPKYPDGTDEQAVKRTGTQTIHYVGAGDKTPEDNKQSFDFTRTVTFDNVTGRIISSTPWNVSNHTFGTVETPVVDGYHADKRNAGGTTVTPDDLTKEVTVTYSPNGKIIPVDPKGNPIPNVPTPQYPTDPTDPTKVVPDEPVPTVPGMTPSTPTVTPTDPGKDTPVPYNPENPAKDQVAQIIYRDVNDSSNPVQIGTSGDISGQSGSEINYDPSTQIKSFEDKGYVLKNNGFPAGTVFDNDDSKTQTFYIDFVHGTVPVTPDKPGKPGEPINPNDPNGPKWPEGTDENSIKKTGTQTIHYVGAGDKTPADNKQDYTFTKNMVVDKVTGQILDQGSWNATSHTFGTVETPVVDGYHADKRNAGGTTVTIDDLNKTVTVTYTPNGKIVPVDPNGNPIPNVPTPQYPTDPTDPTKVTPDEPVPTVPGMTPSTPTVTPTDPGKDTPVPYNPDVKDGSVQVIFHDDTTNSTISGVGYNSGSQKDGTKVDYTTDKDISNLENKGYEYVNTDGTIPAEITGDKNITVTVHMKHGTTPVSPDKPGKPGEPINPNDPDGPKWPDDTSQNNLDKTVTRTITFVDGNGKEVSKPVEQSVHFTATGVIDNVTGKWVTPLTWSPDQTVDSQNVPFVDGYHVVSIDKDGNGLTNVKGVTLHHGDDSYKVTVTYEQNGKIIPVDPNGKPIPDAPTPTYPTDPKDPSKVTPNEPVPNVPGYTPSTPNVTPTDPGKDTPVPYNPDVKDGSVQVIFHDDTTNSTISGVGYNSGSQKAGTKVDYTTAKDISDLENKGYEYVSTDGTVPTEITGDKTITVTVHMKHGTVPVTPDKPGKPGTPINPDDPDGPKWPDDTDAKSLTKDVTRTVSFVDENGNQVSASVTQTVHFTASGVLDKVTGQWLTPLTWNDGQSVSGLTSPSIAGYHVVGVSRDADGNNVKSVVLNHNDPSYVVTVTYAKDNPNSPDSPDVPNPPVQPTVTPGKSNVPTPGNSEVPTPTPAPKPENTPTSEVPAPSPKPESPEAPENNESITPAPKPHAENPETIPAPKPHARKGIAYAPVKGNEVVPTNNTVTSTPASEGQASQAELPQTGDKDDTAATILGATAGMIGLLGLSGFKKKRGKKEEN